MSQLWDKDLVKRLSREVRKTNPADWKASRALQRAQWRASMDWGSFFYVLFFVVIPGPMLCLAFYAEAPRFRPDAASGLTSLNLIALAFLMTGIWFAGPVLQLSPLTNTPASGRWVYRHVLSRFRRQVLLRGLAILGSGTFVVIFVRLVVWNELPGDWNLLLLLVMAGIVVAGTSMALGAVLWLMLRRFKRAFLALTVSFLFVFAWEFLRVQSPETPDPQFLGDALFFLPQSQVLHWVAGGGVFPWAPFLFCAGGLLLAVSLAAERLWDRGEAFADELPEEPQEWRAESFAAAAAKEWHQVLQEKAASYDEWDEDVPAEDDEDAEENEEMRAPLYAHQDSPDEHNTPVTAEFRQVMAERLREQMELPDQELFSRAGLVESSRNIRLRLMLRWGFVSGLLLPVLVELASWFPDTWPDRYAGWLTATAVVLAGLPLISSHRTFPMPYSIIAGHWMKIPVDIRVFTRGFFAWMRAWFFQRCLLMTMILLGIIASALMIIGLHEWTGWNASSPVVMERLIHGIFSLPTFSSLLLITVIGMRYWEAMTFFGTLFRPLQLRGIWKGVSKLYAVLLLLSAGALVGGLVMVCMSAEVSWENRQWLYAPLWLLAAEVVHQFTLRFAFYVARRARADLKEG